MPLRFPRAPLVVRRLVRDAHRLVARRPWLYWLAVAALAAWAFTSVRAAGAAAEAARQEWGVTTRVLVATADLRPGMPLAGRTVSVAWPAALAPPGAPSSVPPIAVARQHVAAGDPLRAADVAGEPGPLSLVPAGWLVAPVVESPASGAGVGDAVQVVSDGVVLADEALVVGFVDGASASVTLVAAPAAAAALLPAAADGGRLALLRVP